jgi:N-acyl-D-amino-acid deacylase
MNVSSTMPIRKAFLFMSSTALLAIAAPADARNAKPYDIVITGGTIVDGSGMEGYRGDVAIADGHIVAIGDIGPAKAAKTIDASGLVVAPGFINTHSHAAADSVATAMNMLTQGVTTEIINPDGGGVTDIAAQAATYSANGLAENIGAYIGVNAVWAETMGNADRRPTPEQITTMRGVVERNLAAGAWGVSSGLDYRPSYYAKAEEVIAIVSVAKPWRTNFPNHDRITPEGGFSSYKGMEETISIAEAAGLMPVITHIKSAGKEQGRAPQVLDMVRAAGKRGAWTAIDVYPYLAGQTALQAFLVPGWAADGGNDAMLARFKDPKLRPVLVEAAEAAINSRMGSPGGISLPSLGKTLTDIMAAENIRAGEAVLRTLESNPTIRMIGTFGAEEDFVTFLKYPDTIVGCDCGAATAYNGHPRYYGSFPRVLGKYTRDQGVITLENAVRKMSALPAAVLGMVDRGRLAPGMRADLTLFDPKTVRDNATYEQAKATAKSDGIRDVIVNGVVVLADGAATGAKSGAILRRDRHMPSRRMNDATASRAANAKARSGDYTISFDIAQEAGQRFATGTVKLTEAKSRKTWVAGGLGVLQTTQGWASITATLKDKAGNVRPATLTLDGAGTGQTPVISIALDGNAPILLSGEGAVRAD